MEAIKENLFPYLYQLPEATFKELVGHTPMQVVMGALLGVVVGAVFMLI